MSWMDSWSRPSKHAATPPPFYLTQQAGESIPYCHTCGRVISSRKSLSTPSKNPVKYCSERCRHRKPGAVDRRIEDVFVQLLNGEEDIEKQIQGDGPQPPTASQTKSPPAKRKPIKGEPRILVDCTTVETIMYGPRHSADKVFGRKKNKAFRGFGTKDGGGEWKSVDMEDSDDTDTNGSNDTDAETEAAERQFGAGKTRPPQAEDNVNFSVGGERGWAEKISETPEALAKRLEGQRRAEEREMVRRAARRGAVFGFLVDGGEDEMGEVEVGMAAKNRSTGKNKMKSKGRKGAVAESAGSIDKAEEQQQQQKTDPGKRRRKCEAVMSGSVVEPSFAKGEWAIRWRE